MTVSELIQDLQRLRRTHGEVTVAIITPRPGEKPRFQFGFCVDVFKKEFDGNSHDVISIVPACMNRKEFE